MLAFILILIFSVIVVFIVQGVIDANKTPEQRAQEASMSAKQKAEQEKSEWAYANVKIAEDHVKEILKDPDSAKFRNVGVIIPKVLDTEKSGVVCGEVNSKNSFGGYVGFTNFVVIAGLPAIDDRSSGFVHLWNKQCAHKPITYPPQ